MGSIESNYSPQLWVGGYSREGGRVVGMSVAGKEGLLGSRGGLSN